MEMGKPQTREHDLQGREQMQVMKSIKQLDDCCVSAVSLDSVGIPALQLFIADELDQAKTKKIRF